MQGLQATFWLWPDNSSKYGSAWPSSGEIDFEDNYSLFPTLDIPYVHYNAATYDPNVTAYNCVIDPNAFNTYGLEWTTSSLTILLNGNVCLVDHTVPAAPLTGNEPFDQPFFISLTQALGLYTNAFEPGTTPLPGHHADRTGCESGADSASILHRWYAIGRTSGRVVFRHGPGQPGGRPHPRWVVPQVALSSRPTWVTRR